MPSPDTQVSLSEYWNTFFTRDQIDSVHALLHETYNLAREQVRYDRVSFRQIVEGTLPLNWVLRAEAEPLQVSQDQRLNMQYSMMLGYQGELIFELSPHNNRGIDNSTHALRVTFHPDSIVTICNLGPHVPFETWADRDLNLKMKTEYGIYNAKALITNVIAALEEAKEGSKLYQYPITPLPNEIAPGALDLDNMREYLSQKEMRDWTRCFWFAAMRAFHFADYSLLEELIAMSGGEHLNLHTIVEILIYCSQKGIEPIFVEHSEGYVQTAADSERVLGEYGFDVHAFNTITLAPRISRSTLEGGEIETQVLMPVLVSCLGANRGISRRERSELAEMLADHMILTHLQESSKPHVISAFSSVEANRGYNVETELGMRTDHIIAIPPRPSSLLGVFFIRDQLTSELASIAISPTSSILIPSDKAEGLIRDVNLKNLVFTGIL